MGKTSAFSDMIEQALLNTHTAFIGKIVSMKGDFASVQPLNMTQSMDGEVSKLPKLDCVPVLKSVRKWDKKEEIISTSAGDPAHTHKIEHWEPRKPEPGDVVCCVCADRDISETQKGEFAVPVLGKHMLSSAVVVGIFEV